MGGTAGAVVAMNPMRRLFSGRIKQYQQTWFTHEWVPPKDDGTGSGTSRFFDGFEVERGGLLRKAGDYRDLISGHFAVTIFEEGTHITSLAWNPNQCCAGWASAGMGCGLVRVEDVAL